MVNMNILNSLQLCEGLITRQRSVNGKTERSVIDFALVCNTILPFVKKLLVDENQIYSLSNYNSKNKRIIHSDHNSLITEFHLKIENRKAERKTIFNFKDQDALNNFKLKTTSTRVLTHCFSNENMSFQSQCKKWFKRIKKFINDSFTKLRVQPKKTKKCPIFLKRIGAVRSGKKIDQLKCENLLKAEQAKQNMNKIKSNLSSLGGSRNKQQNIWKLKNKFYPKIKPVIPVAKKNLAGKIITNPHELKRLYIDHFVHRMRSRPILPGMENYQMEVEHRFDNILKMTKNIKFPDWNMQDLDKVLRSIKKGPKSRHYELCK